MMSWHNFEYIFLLFGVSAFPLFFAIVHKKMLASEGFKLWGKWLFLAAIPFVLWDIWATKVGHWSFNERYLLGIKFFNIPIEELLFFVLIPQNCLLIWVAINKYDSWKQFREDIGKHFGRKK